MDYKYQLILIAIFIISPLIDIFILRNILLLLYSFSDYVFKKSYKYIKERKTRKHLDDKILPELGPETEKALNGEDRFENFNGNSLSMNHSLINS